MASFTLECRCGERYHVDDAQAGRRLACRKCGDLMEIRRSAEKAPTSSTPPRKVRIRRKKRPHKNINSTPSVHPVTIPRTARWRVAKVAAWGYLAAALVVAVVLWGLGDTTTVGTVLLFMGRWVFLLPLLVLVPLVAWLRARLLLPLAVGAMVVAGPVMGFRTGWRRLLPDPAGQPVRVVTYNAGRGGATLAQVLPSFLARWQPQIVAFQECGEPLVAAAERLGGWHRHVSKDLCLLSRYPIRAAAVMDRSGLDRIKQSQEKEIGGAGYVVRFVLDGPRGPIRLGNLHLETPRKGLEGLMERDLSRLRMNTEIRDVESHLARQWVDQGVGPLLVLGDFNTPVESRIFRRHWSHLTNAFSVAGTGFGMTKHNGWIRVRIDHVLASDEWHVDRAWLGDETYSDHRPLIVDLKLR